MVIIFIVLDSKNILVVEDDLDIRELISFNLQNEGHQVFEAKDGEAGIDKAREKLPDLILLDLMLPGIQGLDVCRIIKSCLLYTSPSPRDRSLSRMPSSA